MSAPEHMTQKLDAALSEYTPGIDRAVRFVTIDQVDMLAEFYLHNRTPTPAPNAGAVTVKPMVWECRDQVHPQFKAVSVLGTYYIERNKSGMFAWWSPMRLGKTTAHTIIFAKAAAQADYQASIMSAINVQPDPRPLSEAEAFALSAPTNTPHASNTDMQEWAESIQQPDPRDEVIVALVEALEEYKSRARRVPFNLAMSANVALAAAKAVQK